MKWYVIQTKPKKEEEVKSYLLIKGLDLYYPLIENFSSRNGKISREFKPLFPSYIFGKFDLEQSYTLVRWARGVKKILEMGGYPSPVSEEVVEMIKRRADPHGIVKLALHFEPNDRVRIQSGPLKDFFGIFERWTSDHERVRILLNLIGYQPKIELHCSMIEKVA